MNIRQIITMLVLTNIAFFATAQGSTKYVFKAIDNSLNTRMCVAAANNNIIRLKQSSKIDFHSIRHITSNLVCNKQDITNFAAKYDAYKTTKYLSLYAPKEYKVNLDEVAISDLASNSSYGQVQVIYVSSK